MGGFYTRRFILWEDSENKHTKHMKILLKEIGIEVEVEGCLDFVRGGGEVDVWWL